MWDIVIAHQFRDTVIRHDHISRRSGKQRRNVSVNTAAERKILFAQISDPRLDVHKGARLVLHVPGMTRLRRVPFSDLFIFSFRERRSVIHQSDLVRDLRHISEILKLLYIAAHKCVNRLRKVDLPVYAHRRFSVKLLLPDFRQLITVPEHRRTADHPVMLPLPKTKTCQICRGFLPARSNHRRFIENRFDKFLHRLIKGIFFF